MSQLLKKLDEETIFLENYGNGTQRDNLSAMHDYVSNLRTLLAERLMPKSRFADDTKLSLEFTDGANSRMVKVKSSHLETDFFIGSGSFSKVHLSFPIESNLIRFSEPLAYHRLHRRITRHPQTAYVKQGGCLKVEPFIPGTGHIKEFFKMLSQRREAFNGEDLLSIFLQLSEHLSLIHQKGMIHREINENNFLMYMDYSDNGLKKVYAQLIDFAPIDYCFTAFFREKTAFNDLCELIGLFQSLFAYVTFPRLEYQTFKSFLNELSHQISLKKEALA